MKFFAVISSLLMLMLLLGGALVTKTDSGDGCGNSWPLCHGQWIPDNITADMIIEASHRITTGIVFLFIAVLSVWCRKVLGHLREARFLTALAIAFLIIQSLIGAANVLWGQSDFFLAAHFGISLISFSAVFLLTLLIFEADGKIRVQNVHFGRKLRFHTIGVMLYSLVVIYTGALVRHIGAIMICPDWPFCRNSRISLPQNLYEWMQMGHRAAAGMIFIWIFSIWLHVRRHYRKQPVIRNGWSIALALTFLQVISGAIVIFSGVHLIVSLFHALLITCLFGVLSYMVFLISRENHSEKRKREAIPEADPAPLHPGSSIG